MNIYRIGGVCRLHLLNKRYKIGDHIIGILDFSEAKVECVKYTVILQCEQSPHHEIKQEFCMGLKKSDFTIVIPHQLLDHNKDDNHRDTTTTTDESSLDDRPINCVLNLLFYITDEDYSRTLFEDKVGIIELGPKELKTKLFSCDFPIQVYG